MIYACCNNRNTQFWKIRKIIKLKQILQGSFLFLSGIINSERKESVLQLQQKASHHLECRGRTIRRNIEN